MADGADGAPRPPARPDRSGWLLDRRQLRRRLTFWRLAALAIAVALIAVGLNRLEPIVGGRHVAQVWIEGIILSDHYLEDAIRELADDDDVVAVVVRIDSPGGSTFASETLYRILRAVAETKPMVVVMENLAASGGYMAALAADHIVARETTITGSIGVVMQVTNVVGLLEWLGIEAEAIRSGPLKAQPNPFERMSPDVRAVTQGLIDEVHAMFVHLVALRRDLSDTVARGLADGRVYTGPAARDNGLIDALGGVEEARDWLEETHGIDSVVPIRDVAPDYPNQLVDRLAAMMFGKSYLRERLTLDGLVSLWHPSLTIRE